MSSLMCVLPVKMITVVIVEITFINLCILGHVVYEMCTGHALSNVIPTEQEYERVEDEECLEILRYIFKRNRKEKLTRSIKKVWSLRCLDSFMPWPIVKSCIDFTKRKGQCIQPQQIRLLCQTVLLPCDWKMW